MRQSDRIFPLIIMVLLLISGIPLLVDSNVEGEITPTRGITITVDQNGGGDYIKIQDAIDNASDGDQIRIWNGTYYEDIIVNKSILLLGNSTSSTIIEGKGTGVSIIIQSSDVRLANISINNKPININGAYGLHIYQESNITIDNCYFYYSTRGADISRSSNIIINNC